MVACASESKCSPVQLQVHSRNRVGDRVCPEQIGKQFKIGTNYVARIDGMSRSNLQKKKISEESPKE